MDLGGALDRAEKVRCSIPGAGGPLAVYHDRRAIRPTRRRRTGTSVGALNAATWVVSASAVAVTVAVSVATVK